MANASRELFDLLKNDHREAKKGLQDILDGNVTGERQVKKVFNLLMAHLLMEEKLMYPRLENIDETRDLIRDGLKEHQQVKQLLKEISGKDLNVVDNFESQLEEVLDGVTHHIREEENQLFPKMERVLDDKSFQSLFQEMREMKTANANKVFV